MSRANALHGLAAISLGLVLTLAGCGGGGGDAPAAADTGDGTAAPTTPANPTSPGTPSPPAAPSTPAPSAPSISGARSEANIFFTGHSLIDNPLPDYVEEIARSKGQTARWNQQNILGSPLRVRTRGDDPDSTAWSGYAQGKNREGRGMNVIDELRNPRTIAAPRYDTLIVAEGNWSIHDIVFEDSVRYLRHYHDRLIETNASGTTYFYETWLEVPNNSLSEFIAFERAAAPVWQCEASRINASLAAQGRRDRIASLPASTALAALVERATAGGIPGIPAGAVFNTLFSDNVHLRPLGMYYMSLVVYSAVYRQSPVGGFAPAGVPADQAQALQALAWDFVSRYYANPPQPTVAACQAFMRDDFCARYWTRFNDTRRIDGCREQFTRQELANPFYAGGADTGYWFPAP